MSRKAARATVYVALLRGINVGGRNLVSMTSLKASFEGLGFHDVRTYINSGNVLFRAAGSDAAALERRIDRMLSREYGLNGRTVVRSHAEMARLCERIAAAWTPDPRWKCNVIFLRRHLDATRVLAEFTLKADIERATVSPGTLLWAARVRDLGRTAMLKFGRSPLYQETTVRNVTTTTRIEALMREM